VRDLDLHSVLWCAGRLAGWLVGWLAGRALCVLTARCMKPVDPHSFKKIVIYDSYTL
jgi:hypothetical protein